MKPLGAHELLQVWEWGEFRHPLDQAVTLLAAASQESSWDAITRLSVGQRDAQLLEFREISFGPHLEGFAECPECQSSLEFTADTRILRTAQPTIAAAGSQELIVGDLVLKFRLPTSRDLAKIAGLSDVNDARSLLLSRCIESAKRGENLIALDDLPSEAVSAIEDALTSLDPLAEIRLNLVCAECDHSWEVLFDIQAFLWQELRRKAQRLLEEIHMLASNYSWSESAILAMSDARRQYYLGLILQ